MAAGGGIPPRWGDVHRSQTEIGAYAILVWDGHSCPSLLVLLLVSIGMPSRDTLDRKYEYHRKPPHYQKPGRPIFVTFRKSNGFPFPSDARDAVLPHCLHDHNKRYELHATVVMPDHVHLLLTPLLDEMGGPYSLPTILKLLKGTSARTVNKLLASCGPVWQEESFDHVLRSQESFQEKLEYVRQNPVRQYLAKRPEEYRWLWIKQTAGKRDTSCGEWFTVDPRSGTPAEEKRQRIENPHNLKAKVKGEGQECPSLTIYAAPNLTDTSFDTPGSCMVTP
jgi:REP element-mobilizing transposase RayT